MRIPKLEPKLATHTREGSPSRYLLSAKVMESAIVKERMRCDRHGHHFSLLVLHFQNAAQGRSNQAIRRLAKVLHKRLRLTDEKGWLLKGGIGVVLPMTDLHGARIVKQSLHDLAEEAGVPIESDIFTYSGQDATPSDTDQHMFDSDSELPVVTPSINGVHDTSDGNETPPHSHVAATGSIASLGTAQTRLVRADDYSQIRQNFNGQVIATSTVPTTHMCPRYPFWKRAADIVCALIGLLLAAPLIAIAAVAIKLTSKGPVFFRQMRAGQFGNAFPMYKLRTMVVDAEELKGKLQQLNERDGPAFKIKNDPRVTRVGSLLRKTGVDELPQLWNVLMGHMAIVGPRPLPCSEDSQCAVWQRRRLDTKPGLTCIWQISKSRKVSFEDWMRMDLRYSDRRTPFSDVALMFKTVLAMVLGRVGH